MTRYEVEMSDDRWVVIDRVNGLALRNASEATFTRLEAQALADFRNGIQTSTQERIQTRLQTIRLAWKAIVGTAR
jgi:hypothetical protein